MKLSHAELTTLSAIAELQAPIGVGSGALLGTRLNDKNMNDQKPNVTLALTPNDEWRERYQARLKNLCPAADSEAMDSDNDLAMQSRMFGETPEQAAECVANEIIAWSVPNDPS